MLSLAPTVRVFVAVEPLDMRGSFDALAGAVRRLGLDPVDGHLFQEAWSPRDPGSDAQPERSSGV
jgi:hypothetical protein